MADALSQNFYLNNNADSQTVGIPATSMQIHKLWVYLQPT